MLQVLVATSGKIDQNDGFTLGATGRIERPGQRVRLFECGNNAFATRQFTER